MIKNFIKEVKDFYIQVYKINLKELSLQELQDLDKKFKSFYNSPILKKRDTEEEKLYNLLSYDILSFYFHFCRKDEYVNRYLEFIDEVIHCLDSNPNFLKDIMLKFYNNVEFPINRIISNTTKVDNPLYDIVFNSDLNTYNYLYYYGENITNNQIKIVDYFNKVSPDTLISMANCVIDSFLRGLEHSKVDIAKKEYAILNYPIGFEKLAKQICTLLEGKLKIVLRLGGNKFDKQISYNHRYDYNFYQTKEYVDTYLGVFKKELIKNKQTYEKYAGPIFIETFGEDRFIPKNGEEVFEKDKKKAELSSLFDTEFSILYEEYIRKNTSFTIISYPCPEIGKDFEEIFNETIKINTLDNNKYQEIHQKMIDVLDTAKYVKITGRNGNKTNLTVALANLEDPKTQTLFENCLADVNVPVGEVFTSPKLKGTNGTLNVSEIYLHGWKFIDLLIEIKDGMIEKCTCKNFASEKENQEYINEHLLYDNKTLPMGEFAIGTNTHAYVMGNKYNINDKLDILIAEKTGPHFAFGDTCYSMDEDTKVYNPDGKEIIAKENEISSQRKTDKSKAYFGCHTDVTIPYYELGDIIAISDKEEISIINNGTFVLKGTEELNIEGI